MQGHSLSHPSGSSATHFLPGCSELQQREEWLQENAPTRYLPDFGGFFFPAVTYAVKKKEPRNPSRVLLLITLLQPNPWSTGTWSYATVYYQTLLTLETIVPGTKVKGKLGHLQ